MRRKLVPFILLAFAAATAAFGQSSNDAGNAQLEDRTQVVPRSVKAINYRHRSGATRVDLRGTDLLPNAKGEAKVDSKQGRLQIDVKLEGLTKKAWEFGPEYLTYVLWAITPEGRPQNLGEVLNVDGPKVEQKATTDLQTFALIVTAEPYYAVTQPSEEVILENLPRADTEGSVQVVDAHYDLLRRGSYTEHVEQGELKPLISGERHVPLELLEARNAVRIANWAEADRYAKDSFMAAQDHLNKAQSYADSKNEKKAVIAEARQAVQTAEDARLLALRRRHEEAVRQAQRDADEKARQAELQAQQAQVQARVEAQQRAMAEQQAQQAQQQAQQQTQQAQQQLQQAQQQAQAAQEQAARERADAEAAKQQALQERQQSEQQLNAAQQQVQSAEQRAQQVQQREAELRQKLQQQLNNVLQTRDTAKGLIVSMSDVLFDLNQATLKPGARERLAKVAGILLAYPDLKIRVDGYTDSTGTPAYNRELSQRRADTVRAYLLKQGIPADAVVSEGFGQDSPVATNATAEGRQQNRRVEMVVSGQSIGNEEPTSATAQ